MSTQKEPSALRLTKLTTAANRIIARVQRLQKRVAVSGLPEFSQLEDAVEGLGSVRDELSAKAANAPARARRQPREKKVREPKAKRTPKAPKADKPKAKPRAKKAAAAAA